MATEGWIKLYRKIEDNPMFTEKPYDRAHAWLDILLTVAHEPKDFLLKGRMVHLEPGQMVFGYRKLAAKWGWSKDKVVRYLATLTATQTATVTATPNGTVLTVEKWASYQGGRDSKRDTDRDTRRDSDKPHTRREEVYKKKEYSAPKSSKMDANVSGRRPSRNVHNFGSEREVDYSAFLEAARQRHVKGGDNGKTD